MQERKHTTYNLKSIENGENMLHAKGYQTMFSMNEFKIIVINSNLSVLLSYVTLN